jgi:hypothetical protein
MKGVSVGVQLDWSQLNLAYLRILFPPHYLNQGCSICGRHTMDMQKLIKGLRALLIQTVR